MFDLPPSHKQLDSSDYQGHTLRQALSLLHFWNLSERQVTRRGASSYSRFHSCAMHRVVVVRLLDLPNQSGNPYLERVLTKNSNNACSLLTKLLHSWTTIPLAANMAKGFVFRNEGLEEYPN